MLQHLLSLPVQQYGLPFPSLLYPREEHQALPVPNALQVLRAQLLLSRKGD